MIEGTPNPAALWNALAPRVREILRCAAESAAHAGGEAYLVGGPVRELLLGETDLRDIDIAVTYHARAVAEVFAAAVGGVIKKGSLFGT